MKVKSVNQNPNPTLLVEKDIGKHAKTIFEKKFRNIFKDIIVSNSKKGVPKGHTHLEFICKDNSDSISNGRMIERFQNECLLLRASDPSRVNKKNILPMKFETSDARAMKDQYETSLKIVKLRSQGANAILEFDVTDIKDRNQLVKRIAAIFDAKITLKENYKAIRDKQEVERFIKHFRKIGNIEKSYNEFKTVTGAELINLGYAIVVSKLIDSVLYRILRLFKDKVNYYYFDRVVNLEETYIIKLRKPEKIEKMVMDWEEEFWIRYVYGEQVYPGGGFFEIDQFQKDILEVHNKKVKEEVL